MIGLPQNTRIFPCTQPFDFRKGFDEPNAIVTASSVGRRHRKRATASPSPPPRLQRRRGQRLPGFGIRLPRGNAADSDCRDTDFATHSSRDENSRSFLAPDAAINPHPLTAIPGIYANSASRAEVLTPVRYCSANATTTDTTFLQVKTRQCKTANNRFEIAFDGAKRA